MTDSPAQKRPRPLSPHLQVYKPQITSATSIFHRISGFVLFFGTFFLTWWLFAAASGPEAWATFYHYANSLVGKLILFGWAMAISYHLLNGVRHLIWDTGRNLDIKSAERSGIIVGADRRYRNC